MSVEIKSTRLTWILEKFIFSCFLLAFAYSVTLAFVTFDSGYISAQYIKNWQSNYIIDIQVTQNDTCPENYEREVLGFWSGFSAGCICGSNVSFQSIAFDDPDQCANYKLKSNYVCHNLMKQMPVALTKYKNNTSICVERSNKNFYDLFATSQQLKQTNSANLYQLNADANYINQIRNNKIPDFINPKAIVDLKIVNTTTYSVSDIKTMFNFDLSGYSSVPLDSDNVLFIKRLNSSAASILDVNKLIIDVRLANELWCAYLDISPPKGTFQNSYFDYGGFKTCENYHLDQPGISYFDNYKRTESLNFAFDTSPSKFDFYMPNGIINFYYALNFRYNSQDQFPAQLVSQKYLYGMGCPLLNNPNNHINKLQLGFILMSVSKFFCAISVLIVLLSLVYLGLKFFKLEAKLLYACLIAIIVLTVASMIIMISYATLSYNLSLYLNDFSTFCQVDLFDIQNDNLTTKTSTFELKFYNDLIYPFKVSGFLSVLLFINSGLTILYLVFLCLENQVIKNNNKEMVVYMENQIHREMEHSPHGFNEVDKTDVRSKL